MSNTHLIVMGLLPSANSSCGKVMFSQLSVCPYGCVYPQAEGRNPPGQIPSLKTSPPRQTPLAWAGSAQVDHPPVPSPADGHYSGRYATYWNAFLFEFLLCMSDATLKIADTLELRLIRAMKLKM